MDDKTKIALELIKLMITNDKNKYDFESKDGLNRLKRVISWAQNITEEMFKTNNTNDLVYCEDIIIISHDNGNPERIYLTKGNVVYESIDPPDGMEIPEELSNGKLRCVSVYSKFGQALLGSRINESNEYTSEDGSIHYFYILSIKKTSFSKPMNKFEVQADIEFEHKQSK